MLLFFRITLRIFSYEKIVNAKRPVYARGGDQAEVVKAADHVYRLLGYASKLHLSGMTCLHRSLALAWMLNRRGVPAEIRIGVREAQGLFAAHAWVEVHGNRIGEIEDVTSRFHILKRLA